MGRRELIILGVEADLARLRLGSSGDMAAGTELIGLESVCVCVYECNCVCFCVRELVYECIYVHTTTDLVNGLYIGD